jgi:hypothetical protein
MAVIMIDFNTGHMAMITMMMHSNNNCVAMIIVVMGFHYGKRIGFSSAIICFLIFQAFTKVYSSICGGLIHNFSNFIMIITFVQLNKF